MNKFKLKTITLLTAIAALSGCSTASLNFPKADIPESFQTTPIYSSDSFHLEPNWWLMFNDEELNHLIDYALQNNTDLAVAVLNIKLAQNTLALSKIDEGIQNSARVNFNSEKNLKDGSKYESNSISYSMSYEVDLWNSLSNARNAKEWAVKATEQEKETIKLSLISSIISLYYKSILLSETIAMSQESVDTSKKLLDITEAKFKVGMISGLEVAQAKTAVIEQEYKYNEYIQEQFENTNALKALLNLPPSSDFPLTIKIPTAIKPRVFKNVRADIPSNILKNRPDVLAAQMRLEESFYNAKSVEADFYPKISLTGSLGNSTADLVKFISNPIGSIFASIQLPILDYDRNKENLRISENRFKINALHYQKSLTKALEDVENRISFYYYNKDNYEKVSQIHRETQKISQMYETKYKVGAAALSDLLDAQERQRNAYKNKLNHIYNLINSESQVYQSLGGKYQD